MASGLSSLSNESWYHSGSERYAFRSASAGRIVRERVEPLHAQQPEQGCRVLLAEGPEPRVERTEKLPGGGVPRPAQVQREGVEWGERLGQHGSDGESADGLHAGQSRGPVLAFRELAATGGRVATHLRRTPGGRCSAKHSPSTVCAWGGLPSSLQV